jgi:pyruvate/2-oxoglutarate dehydrogenase complex dihydrolipoamide dehydrogenase (E3) component
VADRITDLAERYVSILAKDGFVKLIFDAKYGELLGAHMIGANVTEMIAEIVAIRKLEVTGEALIAKDLLIQTLGYFAP